MLLWTIFVCAKLHLSLYYFKFIVVIANIKLKSKKYIVLCKVNLNCIFTVRNVIFPYRDFTYA